MRVKVKAYGGLALALGRREVIADLPASATVADLLQIVAQEHGGLRRFFPVWPETMVDALMVVVDKDEVSATYRLSDGDEVLLILPACGGAGGS